jgi:NADH:ubiquinone oxidoreductase subunit
MDIISKFIIQLRNDKVGTDEFGNEYFISKNKQKRYVIYKGIVEPTKIPSEWHVWLHYKANKVPSNFEIKKFFWQKGHIPNLTGTLTAHKPNQNKPTTKPLYESWSPVNNIKNVKDEE